MGKKLYDIGPRGAMDLQQGIVANYSKAEPKLLPSKAPWWHQQWNPYCTKAMPKSPGSGLCLEVSWASAYGPVDPPVPSIVRPKIRIPSYCRRCSTLFFRIE